MTILLGIIALILFSMTGIGFIIFNFLALGLLEIIMFLFTGFLGFIVVGLIISWTLDR